VQARDGDTVVVHVVNLSPYNVSIHWHGILQRLSSWADGPNMVSQCPIRPAGGTYTYRFNVTGQEGTLAVVARPRLLPPRHRLRTARSSSDREGEGATHSRGPTARPLSSSASGGTPASSTSRGRHSSREPGQATQSR